jgi:Tfp pilus assembly protein PilN
MSARLGVDLLGRRRQAPLGWLLLAAGLALLAWQGLRLWQTQGALDAEREGVARLARAAARTPVPAMSAADIRRHAQLDRMARHLAVPWQTLLDVVEDAGGRDVQLLHLAPDAETGRIALTAQARSTAALSAYLLKLEKAHPLADVQLLRHQQGDAGAGVEFDLEAQWRGLARAPAAGSSSAETAP